ncbi:MAG: methyltransferase domain-containing protein [Candidatus Micrarchaeota archaeon]
MPSIRFLTKGYWPLPPFVQLHLGGWKKLKAAKLAPKEGVYSFRGSASSAPLLIVEAGITKALPKKITAFIGRRRFALSRWIGGLYSNADGRRLADLRAFYEAIAPLYRYHVEPGRAHQLSALAAALRPLLPAGSRVLDASAGDCTFAYVAGLALEVWCNDISPAMLALGRPRMPASEPKSDLSSRLCVSSASRLPFPSSSFDALVHTFSNTHALDRRSFRSFHRVLKPGAPLLYHPVKAPGEQWPRDFQQKTFASLSAAGFARVERQIARSQGAKSSTLVFYLAWR